MINLDKFFNVFAYSRPKGASAVQDWQNSLQRQIEFYKWVQTSNGPLGGGVTNSWNDNYADPPASVKVALLLLV